MVLPEEKDQMASPLLVLSSMDRNKLGVEIEPYFNTGNETASFSVYVLTQFCSPTDGILETKKIRNENLIPNILFSTLFANMANRDPTKTGAVSK